VVLSAGGLGDQSCCAHAQEAETPEKEAEYHGAYGDGADQCWITEVADDSRVDKSQQWCGEVRKDYGPGNQKYLAATDLV